MASDSQLFRQILIDGHVDFLFHRTNTNCDDGGSRLNGCDGSVKIDTGYQGVVAAVFDGSIGYCTARCPSQLETKKEARGLLVYQIYLRYPGHILATRNFGSEHIR